MCFLHLQEDDKEAPLIQSKEDKGIMLFFYRDKPMFGSGTKRKVREWGKLCSQGVKNDPSVLIAFKVSQNCLSEADNINTEKWCNTCGYSLTCGFQSEKTQTLDFITLHINQFKKSVSTHAHTFISNTVNLVNDTTVTKLFL